ncbi:MAG: AAA family ATPase [Sphaerochaetaceae bacterium]|nr:AAA family ATPase [Sphaerochaetaceae bacterium]
MKWWQSEKSTEYATLRHISVSGDMGIRGIKRLDLDFHYPLTVVCGKNGSGKTTVLALAALGFHSPPGHKPINALRKPRRGENFTYYTFQDFFFKGPSDPDITGTELSWTYKGANTITIKKRTEKWMHYERRPRRPVHYLGVRRIVPAIEQNVLRLHFRSDLSGMKTKSLNSEFRKYLSNIMGRAYDETDIMSSSSYSLRKCKIGESSFSSFNSGSGEDILMEFLYVLQECPTGSLIIVEEIELGLHPEAVIRLAGHLQDIILKKKLQVIVSTHSEYFIDNVPQISRVLIQRSNREHIISISPTTRFAMGIMTGNAMPEMNVYCEDYFAELLIKQSLPIDLRSRTHIVPVGSNSQLISQTLFHIRAEFGQHILILWDGDQRTRDEAKKWLKELRDKLILSGEREVYKKFNNKVSWGFLPGKDAPELWAIKTLNCQEGYSKLRSQLNCSSDSDAAVIIEELAAMSDLHNIGFELSKKFALEEEEALSLLIRSISGFESKPLKSIHQKVKSVLSNQNVKQKFNDLS